MDKYTLLLHNIIEVQELDNVTLANQQLEKGWKLLEIYTTTYDPEAFYKHQHAVYVLGRVEPNTK